jgi:hypothetical protein
MPMNWYPSIKVSVMVVVFPATLLWNAEGLESVNIVVDDSVVCKKDDACIAYLSSCKHLNDKLSIA